MLEQLRQTQPAHPLLATFLPYLIDDRERLREQAPLAYGQIQQAPLPEQARSHCLDVFQSWLLVRFKDQTLEEILIMLGEMTPLEQTRAYREIVAKNQPIWLAEGRDEGREEGRRREAERVALRLLRRRLGSLTKGQQARVQALPVDQLEDLSEALLDFSAATDLETGLRGERLVQAHLELTDPLLPARIDRFDLQLHGFDFTGSRPMRTNASSASASPTSTCCAASYKRPRVWISPSPRCAAASWSSRSRSRSSSATRAPSASRRSARARSKPAAAPAMISSDDGSSGWEHFV